MMRIQVERGRRGGKAKQPLSVVDRHAVVDQPGCVRVPQVMEPKTRGEARSDARQPPTDVLIYRAAASRHRACGRGAWRCHGSLPRSTMGRDVGRARVGVGG